MKAVIELPLDNPPSRDVLERMAKPGHPQPPWYHGYLKACFDFRDALERLGFQPNGIGSNFWFKP